MASILARSFVFGPALFGSQVQEVVLLAVEGVEPLDMLLPKGIAEPVVAADGSVQPGTDLGQPLGRQGY